MHRNAMVMFVLVVAAMSPGCAGAPAATPASPPATATREAPSAAVTPGTSPEPVPTGVATSVDARQAVWLWNGKITFLEYVGRDGVGLFAMNKDGTGLTRIPSVPGENVIWYQWSPNGQLIAFASENEQDRTRHLHVIRLGDAAPQYLTRFFWAVGNTYPQWAPNSRLMSFWLDIPGNKYVPCMIDVETTETQCMDLFTASSASDLSPMWLPDSSGVFYVIPEASEWYVANLDGTVRQRTPAQMPPWGGMQLSPDGEHVVVIDQDGIMAVLRIDGEKLAGIQVGKKATLSWSADGSQLAFANDTGVYVMHPSDGQVVTLTQAPGEYYLANLPGLLSAWSPDGSSLLVLTPSTPETNFVLRVDGSGVSSLPVSFHWGAWTPDGAQIITLPVYDHGSPTKGDILLVNVDGSGVTNLTKRSSSYHYALPQPAPSEGAPARSAAP